MAGLNTAGELLQLFRTGTVATRSELQQATGLARSTITFRMDALLAAGYLIEDGSVNDPGRGRPSTRLRIHDTDTTILAADLGATHGRLAVATAAGQVLSERVIESSIASGPESVLSTVVDSLQAMLKASQRSRAGVRGLGIGLPGPVGLTTGRIARSISMPGWDDYPVRDHLQESFGLPVVVDNDANLAALAEHRHGAARGADHAVLIALGTGIGAGLVLNGRVYRGARGFGGELGHLVVDHRGEECPGNCPGRGCLEVIGSGRAIGRAGEAFARARPDSVLGRRLANDLPVTGGVVTELAHGGDEPARSVLAEVGRALGAGLCGIVNALDPEVVVVGGGAVRAGDLLLDAVREVVTERALPPIAGAVRIVPAHFGDESGMLGAALLALGEGAE